MKRVFAHQNDAGQKHGNEQNPHEQPCVPIIKRSRGQEYQQEKKGGAGEKLEYGLKSSSFVIFDAPVIVPVWRI